MSDIVGPVLAGPTVALLLFRLQHHQPFVKPLDIDVRLFEFFENAPLVATDLDDLFPLVIRFDRRDCREMALPPHRVGMLADRLQAVARLIDIVGVQSSAPLKDRPVNVQLGIRVRVARADTDGGFGRDRRSQGHWRSPNGHEHPEGKVSVAVPMLLEPLGYGLLGSMPSVASAHPEWVRAQV